MFAFYLFFHENYSKTCVKRPLKIDKTKILMSNGSLRRPKVLPNAPLTFDLH